MKYIVLTLTDPAHPDFMPANREWARLGLPKVPTDDPRLVHLPDQIDWSLGERTPFEVPRRVD